MIVCHCNVISSSDIHEAVKEMTCCDPLRVVTPGVVFSCCGKRPQCGGCMRNFVEHVAKAQFALAASA